jgi:hypothetical protein
MAKRTKTVKIDSGIFQHKDGNIAVKLDSNIIGGVNDNPNSIRYNLHLYNAYKAVLINAGQWDEEIERNAHAKRRKKKDLA